MVTTFIFHIAVIWFLEFLNILEYHSNSEVFIVLPTKGVMSVEWIYILLFKLLITLIYIRKESSHL